MKPVSFVACAALLSGLTLAAAPASANPQVAQYYSLRDRSRIVSGITLDEFQLRGKRYANQVTELKGAVLGSARRADGGTVMIKTNEGDFMVEVGNDIPESQLETGQNIRMLCKILPVAGSEQAEMRALAVISEYDGFHADVERARKEQERRAAEARRAAARTPQMASRGRVNVTRRQAARIPANYEELVGAYRGAVLYFNKKLSDREADRIARNIINYSVRYKLDPRLVMAVIAAESNFNADAVSRVGAMGLGQLMPGTAAGLGVGDAFNPEQNLEGSTRLLSNHIRNQAAKNGGAVTMKEIELALACYNAGAGAVKKYGGVPPYRETRNYIKKITRLYRQLCGYRG